MSAPLNSTVKTGFSHCADCADALDIQKSRILIVDDDRITRRILCNLLNCHYPTDEAENGLNALEMLRQNAYSLVICDIQMPVMNGWELLTAAQGDQHLQLIPFIMITADEDSSCEIQALRLGALDVIRKPFVPEILDVRVRNLLIMQNAARLSEQNKLYFRQFKQQEHLLWVAEHDEMTGLLNRQAIYRSIGERLVAEPERPYMIIRWDIDNFSMYNELFGVQAGDQMLKDIAAVLKSHCSPESVIARAESDHFIDFLPCDVTTPERIFAQISAWLTEYRPDYKIVSHLGVYMIDDLTIEPGLMCDRALLALRSIKGSYTSHVAYYDSSIREKLLAEQELITNMAPAIENGEFEIYFQPQYNYSSHTLVGAEALIRWNHPTRGLLSPGVFLPLFEKNGFISKLDAYTWEKTCQYLRAWLNEYGDRTIPVSVNISRVDTYHVNLCSKLKTLVNKYNIPINMLRLEMTESAYMEEPERLLGVVEELKSAGFILEMDDFGSAYSSLNTLKDMTVDVLKLDMKFLSKSKNAARGGNILSSVVRMARWLKLPVIAEGVETQAQANYLKNIGCLYMQGYYFSKPLPVQEYEHLLKNASVKPFDKYKDVDLGVAEQFWDASTQSTFLFNNFLGGAIIVEKTGDHIEMLRANDQFFDEIHIPQSKYLPFMLDLGARFDEENRARLLAALETAAQTNEETRCEIHSLPFEDMPSYWTSNHVRLLAHNIGSDIFFVTTENITHLKNECFAQTDSCK